MIIKFDAYWYIFMFFAVMLGSLLEKWIYSIILSVWILCFISQEQSISTFFWYHTSFIYEHTCFAQFLLVSDYGSFEFEFSGYTMMRDPRHNKGLAFTDKERDAHYLTGLLPPAVFSQDLQVGRDRDEFTSI